MSMLDKSLLELAPSDDSIEDLRKQMIRQVTDLPRHGTPAAELTERDKLALCLAAGAPYTSEMNGNMLTFRTTVPCGVADDGKGGWIVAIRTGITRDEFDRRVRRSGYVDRVTGARIYDPDLLT